METRTISNFDKDFMKKLNILSVIRDKGESEALRLYPELENFIVSIRGKSYATAKQELLKQTEMSLALH